VPLYNSIIGNSRDAGERLNDVGIAPCPFKNGATGAEVPFHNRIIGKFMVDQDRFETNLLQLLEHSSNSECFFIISAIIFEVNVVAVQKQA